MTDPGLVKRLREAVDRMPVVVFDYNPEATLKPLLLEAADTLSALPAANEGMVSPSDPETIIVGIQQFGLAADGSDLRELSATIARLTRERDEALTERDRWFVMHTAHREATDALGKANGELFKRAYEANRRAEAAEAERDRLVADNKQAQLAIEALKQELVGVYDRCDRLASERERIVKWLRNRPEMNAERRRTLSRVADAIESGEPWKEPKS